jgi:hypothetical protein
MVSVDQHGKPIPYDSPSTLGGSEEQHS